MRADKVTEQEERFSREYTDVSGKKFKVTLFERIPGAEIVKLNPGYDSYYYKDKYKKTKIVIHNTAGVLRSDIAALTKKDWHVSVPYVIARDGTIYELFNPVYWAYHLGRGAVGGNKINSRSSIAIELSSYGPLKRVGDNLETMYSEVTYTDNNGKVKTTGKDVYCEIHERQHFVELPVAYRGYRYFAGYTDAQLKSLNALIDYLSETFDIPKQILDESSRNEIFKSSSEAQNYTGICSHVNFIEVGKWDIGPEMDWSYLFPKESPEEPEETIEEPEEIKDPEPVPSKPSVKKSFISIILNLLKKILKK